MTLGMGWAWLDARIGDNRAHRHIAHQISLALDDECEIGGLSPLRLRPGEAVLIPAGTTHCLAPVGTAIRTIYVDPMFRRRNSLAAQAGCTRLGLGDASALLAIQDGKQARPWIADFLGLVGSRIIDKRLRAGLAESEPGTSPTAFAEMIGLSPARLREIAVHDFGVPPSKLLQWLQLQRAIEALRQSRNLANAAEARATPLTPWRSTRMPMYCATARR
jgi:AraC-like DNA-binding protein